MRLPANDRRVLEELTGERLRVIYAATGSGSKAVILPKHFAVLEKGAWQVIAWSEIQTGAWDANAKILSWQLISGANGHVQLDNPRELPLVFAERVRAAIVTEREILVPEVGIVRIAGRRAPGSVDPLSWSVAADSGVDITDNRVTAAALEEAEKINNELNY
uniref:hypothetical protein n=1 Tax=Vaginimicrobium propionicum TaxID=1871034 RepID=UPI000970330A|nr:hypothetical protein [Vaginimicrobium propionicum]